MSNSTPYSENEQENEQDEQETEQEVKLHNLHQELQALIDIRGQYLLDNYEPYTDPFTETYETLADLILIASNMYIGLRNLEDLIRERLGDEDDAQDA